MSLFLKEYKVILKSPVNFIYVAILCLFFFTLYINEFDSSKYSPPRDEDTAAWNIGFGGGQAAAGQHPSIPNYRLICSGLRVRK